MINYRMKGIGAMINLHNRILAVFLTLVMIVLFLNACNNVNKDGSDSENIDNNNTSEDAVASLGTYNEFDIVAQNEGLTILLNKDYGSISLLDNKSGTVISTTGGENDLSGIVMENTKNIVNSHIVLEFYDNREKQIIYNSYEHCIKSNQIKFSGIKNGVRVYYTIGSSDTRTTLPDAITAETMENVVFSNINEEQKEMVLLYFKLFDPKQTDEEILNSMAEKYPLIKEEPIYVLSKIGQRFIIKLSEIFSEAGVTLEKIDKEYEKIGYETSYEEQPCFVIPVDYVIEDNYFCVSVDCSNIEYNQNMYKLTTLKLLPYFGSMNYTKDGYMFMPDGSGILINGDSTDNIGVNLNLFGEDFNNNAMKSDDEIVSKSAIMPVFGIKNEQEALFAVIEDGAGITNLSATTSADPSTLNHISPNFEIYHRESSESKGMVLGTNIVRYSKDLYQGRISIRYYLLSAEKADYAGMAETYQKYLFSDRSLQKKETPFYISSIGVVNRNERFIGMPVVKQRAITDTSQAKQILQAFISKGVNNIAFNYHNWINDEKNSKVPTKAKPAKAIGGKNGLDDLCAFAKQNGIDLFLNLQLIHASKDSLIGGFNSWAHGAKALDGTYTFEKGFYLSPKNVYKAVQILNESLDDYDTNKISVDTLGSELYSDFTEKDVIIREEAISYYKKTAKILSENSLLMTDIGNAYMLPYVSDITNLPLYGSHYSAETKSIPFAPMVLHGYVNYTGEPLNLQTDKRKEFLKSVEYGAGLFFILNNAKSEMLKQTLYTDLFSSEYTVWTDKASEYYKEARKMYELTAGAKLIHNDEVDHNIYRTDYDNGISVYVNYNTEDRTFDGYTIPKESFVLTKR